MKKTSKKTSKTTKVKAPKKSKRKLNIQKSATANIMRLMGWSD